MSRRPRRRFDLNRARDWPVHFAGLHRQEKTAAMSDKKELIQAGTPLRVLIAEHNPRDVKLVVAALERSGYRLNYEAVDSLVSFQEQVKQTNYEIIISDYNLRDWT